MRKELQDLVFLGRLENTVELAGNHWTLTTLSAQDRLDATLASSGNQDAIARISSLKIELLKRSLKKVNATEFRNADEVAEFVGQLQGIIIDRLFTKYEDLQAEHEKALDNIDDLKNS